jgi:Phage integrase family
VFPAERGGPIRRSNFTRRVWTPATRAAGVEGLRFHDLRHTAATLAVAAGTSTRELMVRMGHSSSAAALRYQHVMAGRDAAIAAALDELIQGASTLSQDPGRRWQWHTGGTNRPVWPEGAASMIGRGGRELGDWWWACQDLNLGPHPYQRWTAERCAIRPFRRSR